MGQRGDPVLAEPDISELPFQTLAEQGSVTNKNIAILHDNGPDGLTVGGTVWPQFSVVLGVQGGAAATPDNLLTIVRRLPPGAIWQIIAIGRANLDLTAMALASARTCRRPRCRRSRSRRW